MGILILNLLLAKNTNKLSFIVFALMCFLIIGLIMFIIQLYYGKNYVYNISVIGDDIIIKYMHYNKPSIATNKLSDFHIEKVKHTRGSEIIKIYFNKEKYIYQRFDGDWTVGVYEKTLTVLQL
jgi:hypothetical protein